MTISVVGLVVNIITLTVLLITYLAAIYRLMSGRVALFGALTRVPGASTAVGESSLRFLIQNLREVEVPAPVTLELLAEPGILPKEIVERSEFRLLHGVRDAAAAVKWDFEAGLARFVCNFPLRGHETWEATADIPRPLARLGLRISTDAPKPRPLCAISIEEASTEGGARRLSAPKRYLDRTAVLLLVVAACGLEIYLIAAFAALVSDAIQGVHPLRMLVDKTWEVGIAVLMVAAFAYVATRLWDRRGEPIIQSQRGNEFTASDLAPLRVTGLFGRASPVQATAPVMKEG